MSLKEIGVRDDLNIPIWIQVGTGKSKRNPWTRRFKPEPYTFSDKRFWGVDPMGEYIYYLSGDFSKDNQGRVLVNSHKTSAQVLVSFESDVINVSKYEMERLGGSKETLEWTLNNTIGGLINHVGEGPEANGGKIVSNGPDIFLTFVKYRGELRAFITAYILKACEQGERLTSIRVTSSDLDVVVGRLIESAIELCDTYGDIADNRLSGAERI